MKNFQTLLGILLIGATIPVGALPQALMIEHPSGEMVEIGINFEDRFLDVLDRIQSYLHDDSVSIREQEECFESFKHSQWNLAVTSNTLLAKSKAADPAAPGAAPAAVPVASALSDKNQWRNYLIPVTKKEKQDLAFVIKTLGFESLIGIGRKRSSLKRAGERIDHLHPFRFLMTIFTDEELKAGVAAIRSQISWVRDGFFDGITGSLKEEWGRSNVLPYVSDFADSLNIDSKLILPALQRQAWKEFVNILIDNIPREADPNRYNM